ncbi:MAG: glycosyltransferase [Bacteroides sp.]|nr:glycosyltransferase [Bacteroides sp.]
MGDGPTRKELEAKFAAIDRVSFVGYQNPEPFYRDASVICLTSDFEGWGMVLTETMMFGTVPVVFNSYAAVTDIIEDGETELLVPPFSCSKYVNALRTLMENEELRGHMSTSCRESVHRFDIQNIADQWEDLFKNFF